MLRSKGPFEAINRAWCHGACLGCSIWPGQFLPWLVLALCVPLSGQPFPPAAERAPFAGPARDPFVATAQELENEEDERTLRLENLDLLDTRDGFAIPDNTRFLPGDTVHLYFQIDGYEVGEQDRVSLRWEVEALDPAGRRFHAPHGGSIDTEVAPQDEEWMPVVRFSPRIPDYAAAGTYSIRILVEDKLAGTATRSEVPIGVDGTSLQSVGALSILDFQFVDAHETRNKTDGIYRAGESVRATFLITGYATREDNSYDVESDAWVQNAEGEKMYKFESSEEKGRPFYPRLWLPARIRVDLDRDIPAGNYIVFVRVRDGVSGSDLTQSHGFVVR